MPTGRIQTDDRSHFVGQALEGLAQVRRLPRCVDPHRPRQQHHRERPRSERSTIATHSADAASAVLTSTPCPSSATTTAGLVPVTSTGTKRRRHSPQPATPPQQPLRHDPQPTPERVDALAARLQRRERIARLLLRPPARRPQLRRTSVPLPSFPSGPPARRCGGLLGCSATARPRQGTGWRTDTHPRPDGSGPHRLEVRRVSP